MTITCPVCGQAFTPQRENNPQKTCSHSCGSKLMWQNKEVRRRKPVRLIECATCGKQFEPPASRDAKFCSHACFGRAYSKNGIYQHHGRSMVRLRDGGRQTYARSLMEAHLGRHLDRDEVVHHINGDKADDRLENLAVLSNSEHTSLHMRERHAAKRAASILYPLEPLPVDAALVPVDDLRFP
jgi:predicted nucleic acid-binding Zn ribbon protein